MKEKIIQASRCKENVNGSSTYLCCSYVINTFIFITYCINGHVKRSRLSLLEAFSFY